MTHADEARKHISWTHQWQGEEGDTSEANLANAHLAMALATLELAEQQRIANLIALASLGEHAILTEQVAEDAAASLVEHKKHAMGGYFQLNPNIAATLGITEEP